MQLYVILVPQSTCIPPSEYNLKSDGAYYKFYDSNSYTYVNSKKLCADDGARGVIIDSTDTVEIVSDYTSKQKH